MAVKDTRSIAEEHWLQLEGLLHKVFVDAFVQGHKYSHKRVRAKEASKETK